MLSPCNVWVGIPVMRYERAARPCALNFRLAALKCRFGRPPNALSSVGVWPSMPPPCASFIQNVITLTGHLFIGKNVAYPNTVTCLLISNCSGKQTDLIQSTTYDTSNRVYFRWHVWNYMHTIQVQSALFKIKQLSEKMSCGDQRRNTCQYLASGLFSY